MADPETPKPFQWVGGHLSLDFNNTVDWNVLEPNGGEYLSDYGRLVEWSHEASTVSRSERDALLELWAEQPTQAQQALERARFARTVLHRVFTGVIKAEPPVSEELPALNAMLEEAPVTLEYRDGGTGDEENRGVENKIKWTWSPAEADLAWPIWPIIWSASYLLTSPEIAHLKTCANERCGWMFLDTSRKHNRKWCQMGVCGNRAKARRYYARHRRGAESR